jgi:hypothetical protein
MLVMGLRTAGMAGATTMAAARVDWQDGCDEIMMGWRRSVKRIGHDQHRQFTTGSQSQARVDKAKTADENRARFGRTKAQRIADGAEEQRRAAILDGARVDRSGDK